MNSLPPRKEVVTVRVETDYREALKDLAEKKGVTLGAHCREILQRNVQRAKRELGEVG